MSKFPVSSKFTHMDRKRGRMLTAREVVEIVRRVWPRAASMLSPVFACDAPGLLGGAPVLPVGGALDVFFLKAVAVPPNKFRPPSYMNGIVSPGPSCVCCLSHYEIWKTCQSTSRVQA